MKTAPLLAVALAWLSYSPIASACAEPGFVVEEDAVSAEADQRILVAQTRSRTVVIASVPYLVSGAASTFLIPLQRPPVSVDESSSELFDWLSKSTRPEVRVVDRDHVPSSGGGCSCLGFVATACAATGSTDEPRVAKRGETRNYEFAVLEGSAAAMAPWLEREGFTGSSPLRPAIDAYLQRGWALLAARPKAAAASGLLAPIEIHYAKVPTDELEVPLAFLPEGAERVLVELYLLGEPLLPKSHSVVRIDRGKLRASSPVASNYRDLSERTLSTGALVLEFGDPSYPASLLFPPGGSPATDPERSFPAHTSLVRLRARFDGHRLRDLRFRSASTAEVTEDRLVTVGFSKNAPAPAAIGIATALGWLARRRWRRPGAPSPAAHRQAE